MARAAQAIEKVVLNYDAEAREVRAKVKLENRHQMVRIAKIKKQLFGRTVIVMASEMAVKSLGETKEERGERDE